MASQAPPALVMTRQIAATPKEVFAAWTEPELMKQWFGPTPEVRAKLVEVDLRVGGAYKIGFTGPEGPMMIVAGKYLEVEPPRRLVYTWMWEDGAEHPGIDTRVTVAFQEADGGTELTITHEQFGNDEMREKHEMGWNGCVESLVSHFG